MVRTGGELPGRETVDRAGPGKALGAEDAGFLRRSVIAVIFREDEHERSDFEITAMDGYRRERRGHRFGSESLRAGRRADHLVRADSAVGRFAGADDSLSV